MQGEYVGDVEAENGRGPLGCADHRVGRWQVHARRLRRWPAGRRLEAGRSHRDRRRQDFGGQVTRFQADRWDAEVKNSVLTINSLGGNPVGTLKKTERKSPTLGAKAPAGAIVVFDGSSVDQLVGAELNPDKTLPSTSAAASRRWEITRCTSNSARRSNHSGAGGTRQQRRIRAESLRSPGAGFVRTRR